MMLNTFRNNVYDPEVLLREPTDDWMRFHASAAGIIERGE
jgi:hypothetical protein